MKPLTPAMLDAFVANYFGGATPCRRFQTSGAAYESALCATCHYTAAAHDVLRLVDEVKAIEPERVVCAAIRFASGHLIHGHRHHDCFRTAGEIPIDSPLRPHGQDEQGFITTRGRFVDRVLARELQQAAGIESKRGAYQHELYSEDVY